jgi:hypothetical protein
VGRQPRRSTAAARGRNEGRAARAEGPARRRDAGGDARPGAGKTHRAYLWTYCSTALQPTKLVVFDFAEGRASRYPAEFFGHPGQGAWRGTLVCDDYSGYKALFASGVTEAGCLAHARRKFHELWVNHKSPIGEQALALFGRLYAIEREVAALDAERRRTIRQEKGRPVADALRTWLTAQRQKVPPGSATAKAIDYTLGRWAALTRYIGCASTAVAAPARLLLRQSRFVSTRETKNRSSFECVLQSVTHSRFLLPF